MTIRTVPTVEEFHEVHLPNLVHHSLHEGRILVGELRRHDAHVGRFARAHILVGEDQHVGLFAMCPGFSGCVEQKLGARIHVPDAARVVVVARMRPHNMVCTYRNQANFRAKPTPTIVTPCDFNQPELNLGTIYESNEDSGADLYAI